MENKNTGLIVAIVILALLVLGLGGFIIYDKVLNTSNDAINNGKRVEKLKENGNDNAESVSDRTENESIVVDDFVYGKVVKTVHKDLIGKYVSTETKDTYFEINEKGEVNLSYAGCSGISKYGNDDVEFKYFYPEPREGNLYIFISVSSKMGSQYTLKPFRIELQYNVETNTVGEITSDPIGCSSEPIMKYNKQ